jgi:hypothetical protein
MQMVSMAFVCVAGECLLLYVADADAPDLAGREELLHRLPGIDVGVGVDDVSLAIWERREAVMVSCNPS